MEARANLRRIIDVGLLEQHNGWVFVGCPAGQGHYGEPLFSGKRKTLEQAMDAAKTLAPSGAAVVYSRLESSTQEWKPYDVN